MKLTLAQLKNPGNRHNIQVRDLEDLLRSYNFERRGKDSRGWGKWVHGSTKQTVSVDDRNGKVNVGGVTEVYQACLVVENSAIDKKNQLKWQEIPLSNELVKQFEAHRLDNKIRIRYADFHEFAKEFETNSQTGNLQQQLQRHADKLEVKFGSARQQAVDLQKKYGVTFVRHNDTSVTVRRDDLGLKIDCVSGSIPLGDQLVAAIKAAGAMVEARTNIAEKHFERLTQLGDSGFTLKFEKATIVITHPEAEKDWHERVYYPEAGAILTQDGLAILQKLENGSFPRARAAVAVAKAEQQPTPETVDVVETALAANAGKRLKSISLADFQKDLKAHLGAAQDGTPKAVKNASGETLAIIMPLVHHAELEQTPNIRSITVTLEALEKATEQLLLSIRRENACAVIKSGSSNEIVGFILTASYEDDVAATTPDEYLAIDGAPEAPMPQPVANATPQPAVSNEKNAPKEIRYVYETANYADAHLRAVEFRQKLAEGKIQIVANPSKGFGVYIPAALLDNILPSGKQWTEIAHTTHNSLLRSGKLAQGDFSEFFKIKTGPTLSEKKTEHTPKEPHGFISWNTALRLEQAGILPPIPEKIKAKVEMVSKLGKAPALHKTPDSNSADKGNRTVVSVPAKATPTPAAATPPLNGAIALGNVLNVGNLDIQSKLAEIKARRALTEAFSKVREGLKKGTGFLPVTVDNHMLYATSTAEFVDNAKDIAAMFDLQCTSIEIPKAESTPESKWMDAFKAVAGSERTIMLVHDKSIERNAVVIPASDFMNQILNELGINLE